MFVKHCKVEVYLTELKLCENGNMNNVVTRRFSKADTIGNARSCFFVKPLLFKIYLKFYLFYATKMKTVLKVYP